MKRHASNTIYYTIDNYIYIYYCTYISTRHRSIDIASITIDAVDAAHKYTVPKYLGLNSI